MKERKRILNTLARLKRQGYTVSNINIGKPLTGLQDYELVTEYLKELTGEIIRMNTYRLDKEGIYVSRFEDTSRKRKASEEMMMKLYENNWNMHIAQFPTVAKPYLAEITKNYIDQYGRKTVYDGINNAMRDGYVLTREIAYSEEELFNYAVGLSRYFDGGNMANYEEVLEAVNTDNIYQDMFT